MKTEKLNGNPNLTIKTMISAAAALDCELNLELLQIHRPKARPPLTKGVKIG